jgi:hypothetical protein
VKKFSCLIKISDLNEMTSELKTLIEEIKEKWDECVEKTPEIFRYLLSISKEKVLDGKFNFLVQVKRESECA